jgi:TolB-like protein
MTMSEQETAVAESPVVLASDQADQADKKKKKKKDKVRSAWISFVGRIVAQLTGAAATIFLGLTVLQTYQGGGSGTPGETQVAAPAVEVEQVVVPARTPRKPGELVLAVLPLDTYSPTPQDHLANGITEAVISDLSAIKGLGVRSRTSVMPYKGQRKSLPAIAKELGVDLIVEGSITTVGNRARIIVQLIDTKSDEHIWAQAYDRSLADPLSVQAEVAKLIARDIEAVIAQTSQPVVARFNVQ